MKPQTYARIAALVLVIGAAFAVIHRVSGDDYDGSGVGYSRFVDVGLAALWIAGAVAVLVRRGAPAFFVVALGVMAALVQGLLFSVASPGTGLGLPFLAASAVIGFALNKSIPAWRTAPYSAFVA